MVSLADAAAPSGLRLYAIGDIHGCLDKLEATERHLREDLAAHPVADYRVILIGDYIDRGPDSSGVLEWIASRRADLHLLALRGNHEAMMEAFLADPEGPALSLWTANGGDAALASFGLAAADPSGPSDGAARRVLAEDLRAALAQRAPGVIEDLSMTAAFGDYLFVHAGVRPGAACDAQSEDDLLWIREPFLESDADFGAVVVHGHTPMRRVDLRANRIGIDTGAVFGGPLTCLAFEGREIWLIGQNGRVALAPPG